MALDSISEAGNEAVGGFVSLEKYQAQLQRIEDLNQIIDGLFTNEVREISWKEEVGELRKAKEEAEAKYAGAIAKHASEQADLVAKHDGEIEALKSNHLSMFAELENAYEGRLVTLANKIKEQENDHQVAEDCRLKEVSEKDKLHQAQISEQRSSSQNFENKLQEEIDRLKAEVDASEKMRREMLSQQEDEYEKELSQLCFEHKKRLNDKQNEIDEVNIQVQKLIAKRAWLERQSKELKAQVIDVQNERLEATQHSKKLEGTIDRIQSILKQKDELIAQMKAENNAITTDKNSLDKELYTTKTKCTDLEMERAPLEQTITKQNDEATSLRKQLAASQSENDVLGQTVEVNEQKVRSRDSEIKSLRSTIRNRERKLKSIEGELVQLAGISDDKALRNQVKIAYQKLLNK